MPVQPRPDGALSFPARLREQLVTLREGEYLHLTFRPVHGGRLGSTTNTMSLHYSPGLAENPEMGFFAAAAVEGWPGQWGAIGIKRWGAKGDDGTRDYGGHETVYVQLPDPEQMEAEALGEEGSWRAALKEVRETAKEVKELFAIFSPNGVPKDGFRSFLEAAGMDPDNIEMEELGAKFRLFMESRMGGGS